MKQMKQVAQKAVKSHEAKMHGKPMKMAAGGKVRGGGAAKRGVYLRKNG